MRKITGTHEKCIKLCIEPVQTRLIHLYSVSHNKYNNILVINYRDIHWIKHIMDVS